VARNGRGHPERVFEHRLFHADPIGNFFVIENNAGDDDFGIVSRLDARRLIAQGSVGLNRDRDADSVLPGLQSLDLLNADVDEGLHEDIEFNLTLLRTTAQKLTFRWR
jgi:predicted unusual protein kinase regulating ubiquinone biosynthesis (AarF/ABC1/UbiB family)